MRILFVTGSLACGGAERHTITLMNRLAERGHESEVAYLKDEDAGELERLAARSGSAQCMKAARYFDHRAVGRLAAHVARTRPAVIIAVNPYALMYAWLALRLARVHVPLAVTFHSNRLLDATEWLQMLVYRAFFWSADASVFVCEAQRRHWARRGVFSRRSAVIYNGVDTDEFRDRWSSAERQALRTALGFTESDYVVGIAARLRPEKNHLQLVDAIAQLRGRGVAARALLIGDGEMRAAIEARAHERDVHRHVVITGFKPDVRPYLVACDVATLVSHTEAFSLAAIESMALARPLVHSDVGGAAEMIRPGRSGFLFPPGDTAALVDRLRTLADPSLRARMGAEARAAAEAHFSEAAMVDRYERLLFELAPAGALVSEAA